MIMSVSRMIDIKLYWPVVAILNGWLFAAIALMLEPALGEISVNPALNDATDMAKVEIGLAIGLGCILVLTSSIRWRSQSTAWKLELTGLPLLISGWAYYTISVAIINGWTLFPIMIGLGNTIAGIIRILYLLKSIRETRINVKNMPDGVRSV